MIVKRIDRHPAEHSGDHARNVANLVNYMKKPEKDDTYAEALLRYIHDERLPLRGVERLLHLGARNFLCEAIEERRAEMMACANAAVRSPNPLTHWLLSWKEHERPTNEQIDEAVTIFVDYLGLSTHQVIYAAHADTHNIHCHIAVNRFDPIWGKMKKVHNNRDLLAAHRAVAIIVHRQGWQPEARARYSFDGCKFVPRPGAEEERKSGRAMLEAGALAYEARTGLKSAQRIATEDAAQIMLDAKSWPQLHFRLGQVGIEFLQSRSGAVLKIGDNHIKASSAHRRCSFEKLEKRLGPFKERMKSVEITTRDLRRDVMPNAVGAIEFRESREQTTRAKLQAIGLAKAVRDRGLEQILDTYQSERRALDKLEDGGRSPERRVLTQLIKEKKKKDEGAEQRAFKERCRRIREAHQHSNDLERWLRDQRAHYLADRWRNRNRLDEWVAGFSVAKGELYHLEELNGFVARDLAGVRLWEKDGEIAFVEWARKIELATRQDDDAIVAALTIAVGKFGPVSIDGPDEFKQRAARLAHLSGLGSYIVNPELKDVLSELTQQETLVRNKQIGIEATNTTEVVPRTRDDNQTPDLPFGKGDGWERG